MEGFPEEPLWMSETLRSFLWPEKCENQLKLQMLWNDPLFPSLRQDHKTNPVSCWGRVESEMAHEDVSQLHE